MAATFLGTTGNWGIPNDEAGILINDLAFDFSNQEKTVLNKSGEIIGLALYQEKVEIKLSGLVAKTSAFSGKIGAALTLANTMPAHLRPHPAEPRSSSRSTSPSTTRTSRKSTSPPPTIRSWSAGRDPSPTPTPKIQK